MLTLQSTLTMNDGRQIPRLGFGVFRVRPGAETREAVAHALRVGYRHVDTASVYANERDVGEALARSGLRREEVFVTTKLWNTDQGYDNAIRACRKSLKELGLEWVDLYLIHWPLEGRRLDSWRALVDLKQDGLCRSIGVSNFMVRHLQELLDASPVVPQANQVELSPFLVHEPLRAFCKQHQIVVEAHSPLTKGRRFSNPTLSEIARQHGKSAAQVLLRWSLQKDLVVLPKAVHPQHIEEDAALFDFELSAEEMARLDALDEGLHTGWDPTNVA